MKYVDPDGREVIVGISTSDSIFGQLIGEHAFVMYVNPYDSSENIMLDASGQFGGGRVSDVIDTYQTEISVENYLNYFDTEEKLTIFEISLSDSKEQKIKSAIEGTEGRTFLQCAVRASKLLKDSGLFGDTIKERITPKGLLNDLLKYTKNNSEAVNIREFNFKTKEELIDDY